jgi:hypothetical protein
LARKGLVSRARPDKDRANIAKDEETDNLTVKVSPVVVEVKPLDCKWINLEGLSHEVSFNIVG